MSLGSLRMRKSRQISRQCTNRESLFDAPIGDAADLQSPPQSRSINASSSSDYVRHSEQSNSSSNIPQGSNSVQSTSGGKRTRGRSDPQKLIPKEGEPPFILRISPEGIAVGDNATKWGKYVAEEGSQYHRYPLHKKWDATQDAHVVACVDSAQAKGYYKFVGVENKEGEFTSYDPTKFIGWIKSRIEHKKRKLRCELKAKFLKQWFEATSNEKQEILKNIGEKMPRQHWDALVEFFTKQEKQEEVERNKANRASTQRPRAHGTSGGRTIVNTNYHLKQKNPEQYNPVIGWIETHRGKDQASISYRNQVLEKAADIEVGPDSPLTIITPILDSISGGHHGGYERGIGSGCHRRYTTTPVIHNYAITQTQREVTSQIEVKMKDLESALDAERRTTEEITAKIVEMERRHQEERDTFKAQVAQMHQFMSSFFQPPPGAPGYRFGSSDD